MKFKNFQVVFCPFYVQQFYSECFVILTFIVFLCFICSLEVILNPHSYIRTDICCDTGIIS